MRYEDVVFDAGRWEDLPEPFRAYVLTGLLVDRAVWHWSSFHGRAPWTPEDWMDVRTWTLEFTEEREYWLEDALDAARALDNLKRR